MIEASQIGKVFKMGVAGAALSTLASRIFCTVVIFYCLRKPNQIIVVKDYLKLRPDMALIMKIMAIGIPAGIENGMFADWSVRAVIFIARFLSGKWLKVDDDKKIENI